jgi:HSP20 family protein
MSNATQQQHIQKQEAQAPQGAEFTRARRVFMPRADIYETPDAIIVFSDMPGVDEKNVDITLEKNVLTISGHVEPPPLPSGVRLIYEEYEIGDYLRAFTLSDEVDRDRIEASMKQGVLKVTLPKSTSAKTRKISVKAE